MPLPVDEEEAGELLSSAAEQCNLKKEASKAAQEQCDVVYLCVYVRSLQESGTPLITEGIVCDIGEVSAPSVLFFFFFSFFFFFPQSTSS